MSLLFKRGGHGGGGGGKSFFRGGGGASFWQKSNRSYSNASGTRKSEFGEKLIYIELVGPNTISVKFENFFDADIKDKIKALPDSKYDPVGKDWLLRKDLRDKLFQQIGEMCIDKGVKVVDIPDFVYELSKNPIPFTCKAKTTGKDVKSVMGIGKEFNYEQEVKYNKVQFEKDLPQQIRENLYEFQKKGIEFGVSRFGRVLLGDEMGVGKTI